MGFELGRVHVFGDARYSAASLDLDENRRSDPTRQDRKSRTGMGRDSDTESRHHEAILSPAPMHFSFRAREPVTDHSEYRLSAAGLAACQPRTVILTIDLHA